MKNLFVSSAVLSAIFLFNSAQAAEPKFLQPVSCATEGGDKHLTIKPDGEFELRQKDRRPTRIAFEKCEFALVDVEANPKRPTYKCSSKNLPSGYSLEANTSGYYNLMETGAFKGRPSLGNSALKDAPPVRNVGTFECSDPTYDAWLDAEKRARGTAPAAASKATGR